MSKRKRLLILVSSVLLMAVLTGCGKTGSIDANSTGFGTITLFGISQEQLRDYQLYSLEAMV